MFLRGTLELLIALFIVGIIVLKLDVSLKKNKKKWYLGSWILAIFCFIISVIVFLELINVSFDVWWVRMIRAIVSGYLPGSIFIYVMFTGAIPNGHPLRKKMMTIRTELSIVGVILYLPHTILYTILSAPYGINALLRGEFVLYTQVTTWTGIVLSILLVVLGITSSEKVKQGIGLKKWTSIQKWSYLFYFSCFLHWTNLSLHRESYLRAGIYLTIFSLYLALRIKKYLRDRKLVAKIA